MQHEILVACRQQTRAWKVDLVCKHSIWYVQVTQLEQNMNFLVGTMFLLQVLISVLCALGQNAFNTSRLRQMWYVTAPM